MLNSPHAASHNCNSVLLHSDLYGQQSRPAPGSTDREWQHVVDGNCHWAEVATSHQTPPAFPVENAVGYLGRWIKIYSPCGHLSRTFLLLLTATVNWCSMKEGSKWWGSEQRLFIWLRTNLIFFFSKSYFFVWNCPELWMDLIPKGHGAVLLLGLWLGLGTRQDSQAVNTLFDPESVTAAISFWDFCFLSKQEEPKPLLILENHERPMASFKICIVELWSCWVFYT